MFILNFFSDSLAKIEDILKKAKEKKIDCIAITDHNEIEGALKAFEIAKDFGVLVIPGIEVKSKEGDIIGLNLKEKIEPKLSAKETIKKIKERGGFVILPHPFAFWENFKGNLKEIIKEIDAIEIYNASVIGKGNKRAENFVKKYNLPFIAGSDAHFPGFVGKAFVEIEGENLSIEEIFEKIKNKEIKIKKEKTSLFEKVLAHIKRNLAKIVNYVERRERKI
jgi:hypothetical protein